MGTVRYTVIDGEIIAEKRNGVRSLYVPDPLGSTVALIDNTQTVTDTFSYWPYGENNTRTGTTATPFQFVGTAGYHRDAASRTYVRARTLKTDEGRWMAQDPLGFKGGDWDLYRYAKASPASDRDPSGLTVYVCQASFGAFFHQCVSTNMCGSWGKVPAGPPTIYDPGSVIQNCDYNLKKLPNGVYVPGQPAPGVTCWQLGTQSPAFERAVCACMERARARRRANPRCDPFVGCGHNCQNWAYDMLVCGCSKSGLGDTIVNGSSCGWADPAYPWQGVSQLI